MAELSKKILIMGKNINPEELTIGKFYAATWRGIAFKRDVLIFLMPEQLGKDITHAIDRSGVYCYTNVMSGSWKDVTFREATFEEISELTSAIIANTPKLKIGDWVTVEYHKGTRRNYWLNETDERTFEITHDGRRFTDNCDWGTKYKGHTRGLGRELNLIPATTGQIVAAKQRRCGVLPEINGYRGKVSDDKKFLIYGCAHIAIVWFSSSSNRHLTGFRLSSGVIVSDEQVSQILKFLEKNSLLIEL